MKAVATLLAAVTLAARRLWNHRLLMLCLLIGLTVAVGLLSSIPLYSDAVNNRLLQGELTDQGTRLPPFAFVWRYIGVWNGDIDQDVYEPLDTYLTEQAAEVIGLPLADLIRHQRTPQLRLFPSAESQSFVPDEPLLFSSIGFITDLADHIQLIEGEFPHSAKNDAIPVLVSQTLADQLGLQVDERYVLFGQGSDGAQIPVTISGVWRALDLNDPFWFYQPNAFDDVLLTTEDAFREQVSSALENPISQAIWYQLFDGSRVRTGDVAALLEGVRSAEARATALLDGTTLDTSPVGALENYGDAARLLTTLLTAFAIPIVGLVLYFISLIAGMVVQRGQNEIAVLRSRGATRLQILGVYALEGMFIGVIGLALGLLLGQWLAQLMSRTRTFLDTGLWSNSAESLAIVLSPTAWQYALIAVGLAIIALLIPALAASRFTIVTFKWERARSLRKPLWQRFYLDVLLLIPPLYGWYLLSQQGSVAILSRGDDPFSNPLLFLVPALFCFALSLLFIRFFPLLMNGFAWLTGRLPGVSSVLTMRQLARAANQYTGPLLLIALTISLAAFTASMALTLDDHLTDEIYYAVGADMSLVELGENTETPDQPLLPGQEAAPTTGDEDGPRFLFLPVAEHLAVPGVRDVARVADYTATSSIGGRQQAGRLLGIDRIDFGDVAFFRSDFANDESLGALLNRLGAARDNVLVSRAYLTRNNLEVGDPLRLTVGAAGDFADVPFTVAGAVDLFPSYYPDEGPLFVANLDYVHEGMGGQYPYNVWARTDRLADANEIVSGVRDLGIVVVSAESARGIIAEEQLRPERQGVFGLLSVGFVAAAALTVLGFLVYAIVSFQRRFIELGMLRAIGLSIGQMSAYLSAEQALIVISGMGLGTLIGVAASTLFIPFLQVGLGSAAQVPPFIVKIAWDQLLTIYAIFGGMFVVAVVILIILLLRMKVFEAVKLGEAV